MLVANAPNVERRGARFLETKAHTGKIAVVRPDGSPMVVPIWFDVDDERSVVFTTWHETIKASSIRRDPRVSICADDEEPPFDYVRIDGVAQLIDDLELLRHWARLAAGYMGVDRAEAYGIDAPAVPPLAEDVTFVSPLLTAEATGRSINERILTAASQCYGVQNFRAVLQVEGQPAIAAVVDGVVERNVLQLVAIFTLNNQTEVSEIRVFSRPWPVTAYFRRCIYRLLKDSLGPEYWQGPDPESPLPIR